MVWKEALENVHMRRKLTSIQRKFLIKINRAYNTAPTNALQIMANTLPIHLKAKYIIWNWYLTAKSTQHGYDIPGYDEIYHEIKNNCKTIDITKPNFRIDRKLKKDEFIEHPAGNINYTIHWDNDNNKEIKSKWKIYTDGSKNDNGTGAGFIVKNNNDRTTYQHYYSMATQCTNSQAEMFALLKAIQHIQNNIDIFKGSISILTDSKAALHNLNQLTHPTALAKRLYDAANTLGTVRKLSFGWIRGHSGVKSNEIADKLAKLGASSNISPSFTDTPQVGVKNYIMSLIEKIWQHEWETGRNCFLFIPSIQTRKKAKHYVPNSLTTQVLLGHGNFPAYLHRFKLSENDKCDCSDDEIGDAAHFAFLCTKHDNYRTKLMHEYLTNNPRWPPTEHKIFENKTLWRTFEEFIYNTGALVVKNSEHQRYNTEDTSEDENNLQEESMDDNSDEEESS
ncbi:uncharacterized protein LOC111634920 [Centruroides sculpturatus]|uniref:uncharacterized protein LOC111634920 n=1 Tax=Centruroides sculpturatus TaxID=218467 RepID=UPI000C6E13E6|nr:uncharacterized protein LOC111634920 [Centruroides sculpturatus]